jgi:hypothetical protein
MRKSALLSMAVLVLFLASLFTLQNGKNVAFAADSGSDQSQAVETPARVNRIRTGGIRFGIYRFVRLDAYQDQTPVNGTFLIVTGALEAEQVRCVYTDDFKVLIGDVEYTPVIPVMEFIQPAMRGREFPGDPLSAQCLQAGAKVPTYLVFDLPLSEVPATLRFFEREGVIGDLSLLEIAEDTEASMLRSVVGEPHRLRRNSNVRACAGTTCDILHVFARDQTAIKIGETFGMEVRGSQLWYEVLLDDDTIGYVHSSLMRRINP